MMYRPPRRRDSLDVAIVGLVCSLGIEPSLPESGMHGVFRIGPLTDECQTNTFISRRGVGRHARGVGAPRRRGASILATGPSPAAGARSDDSGQWGPAEVALGRPGTRQERWPPGDLLLGRGELNILHALCLSKERARGSHGAAAPRP